MRGAGHVHLLVLLGILAASAEESAAQGSKAGTRRSGFRLFAGVNNALTVNRVSCGLIATGQICVDSAAVAFGAYWPRGTNNHYVFNSGFQISGVVGGDQSFDWRGDTTGAWFFSGPGITHGTPVGSIFNSTHPEDRDNWPAAAFVPNEENDANVFHRLLRGRINASQGDVWWLTWDGEPSQNAQRPHPLGVLLEQRGMGWNFPAGNEDIIYFVFTVYNITSTNPAAYAGVRPALRDVLVDRAEDFQALNEKAFDTQLPDSGYPLEDVYVAFAADMDVGQFNVNYASVNVPFALGYTYHPHFLQEPGWSFPLDIFGPPFFAGTGIGGVKYLSSPLDSLGRPLGLTNFGGYTGGTLGIFDEPRSMEQGHRYLAARLDPSANDPLCNTGNPAVTHICFINQGSPGDMRFFQSTGPLTIPPGGSASITVAYIFAPPVRIGSCPPSCDIRPGDPRILGDAAAMAAGVNPVDSITGYAGFDDENGDGRVDQREFQSVPGSLLDKALVAQAVFDNGFLLPFAPESPDFYLIPGDNQVTILWQPSPTESSGDPFFSTASAATVTDPESGAPVANPLYDPSYRQFDVEGYRIYRGRVDSPSELSLVAQFDYSGTFIADFQGQINPVPGCAPELGINTATVVGTDTTFGCPVEFDSLQAGVPATVGIDIPLVGPIIQVRLGDRIRLATGEALTLVADTALTGLVSEHAPALQDNGVPFAFLDTGVRSNLVYFYSVTAFDLNSLQSGPSTIESPRITKQIVPQAPAANLQSSATLTQSVDGRGLNLTQGVVMPTMDPITGRFSGKQPPADNVSLGFAGQFAQNIFSGGGSFSATLIGLGLGDARNGIPVTYTYATSSADGAADTVTIPVLQPVDTTNLSVGSASFPAATADPTLAERFGVPAGFVQSGQVTQGLVAYQYQSGFGRGCHGDLLFGPAADCTYNGPRWFQGPNETKADPNAGNRNGSGNATDNNNAGELPGVLTIQHPQSYHQVGRELRAVEATLAGAVRAADFNLYWGAGGQVDSVVDLTHNVAVPFMAESLGGGWGFLNQVNTTAAGSGDARPADLTLLDWGCVFPLQDPARQPDQPLGCAAATRYTLSQAAVPGSIVISGGSPATIAAAPRRANPGFSLYLAGHIFLFELTPGAVLPAPGTVWTLRSYIGHVNGGNGAAGSEGPYRFTGAPRTFSALGATLKLTFSASNVLAATTANDLSRVHTVPDPYYVTNQFERTPESKILQFVNLPADCIIRIYSSSGILVALLEHHSATFGGAETWNVQNRNNQVVASGVYFYHIEAGDARKVGRFTVVTFAQ